MQRNYSAPGRVQSAACSARSGNKRSRLNAEEDYRFPTFTLTDIKTFLENADLERAYRAFSIANEGRFKECEMSGGKISGTSTNALGTT